MDDLRILQRTSAPVRNGVAKQKDFAPHSSYFDLKLRDYVSGLLGYRRPKITRGYRAVVEVRQVGTRAKPDTDRHRAIPRPRQSPSEITKPLYRRGTAV